MTALACTCVLCGLSFYICISEEDNRVVRVPEGEGENRI
jgi:hypothetical protein